MSYTECVTIDYVAPFLRYAFPVIDPRFLSWQSKYVHFNSVCGKVFVIGALESGCIGALVHYI